jgi:phosphatidylglycerol---prolipoprotein diacylglyceryl transferase
LQPELHIFGLTIQTFGLCLGVAFIVAGWLVARRFRELGRPEDFAYSMVFAALIGGIVGAKLWYVAENGGKLLSGTGLVFYGGLIGGAIAVCAWAYYKDQLDLPLVDAVAPALAAAYAIGRIGCQLSGDGDYGKNWNGPWAMAYPHGTVPTTAKVHPTPVYETLSMGIVALVLWQLRDRLTGGRLFALYLVLAGTERLLVEFIRRNDDVALGLTLPQLLSLAMIAAGVALAARVRRADPQPA